MKAEEKYRDILNNVSDGVYWLNADGYFSFVNKAAIDRSGISPEKFHALHFLDLVDSDYHDQAKKNFQRVMNGEDGIPYELKYKDANGQVRTVEVHSSPIREGGRIVGLLGISRDITDRKRAEEELQESEERFRQLADATFEGIVIHDKGDILDFNQAMLKMFGYERDEVIGKKNVIDFIAPESREIVSRHIATGYEKPYEVIMVKKDGNTLVMEVAGKTISYKGKMARVVALRDITDRKLAEERIKASERQFRTLIESIPIGIFVYEGSKFSYLNPDCKRITGYTRDELYLLDIWEIAHPDYRDAIREYIRRRQQGEAVPARHEFKIITKSGEERWLERVAIDIEMGGKPSVLMAVTDITDRRYMEEVLRKSEEKYQALLENASDAILLADENGNLIEANRMAEDLLGYPREELLQMHYSQLHPMMELEKTIAAFKDIVTYGYGGLQNGAILRKDGIVVPIDITATVIEYNGKKVFQASFRDITEHKRTEDTLEGLVQERTKELFEKNRQLVDEITERKRAEASLKRKTNELQLHSGKLEELNAALRVLLQQRQEDRTELEEKVISNVKHLLSPHLEKLKKRKFDPKSKMHLDILESNLNNIVSSFSHKLSSKHINLTPTEIKVANLVREGKTTKDIAEFLGSSPSSIKIHRFNVRRKLGLIGKKTNLQSYLTSLS
ncbi:MAG: PAS domain S-box protein [Syntrophales bacterium]